MQVSGMVILPFSYLHMSLALVSVKFICPVPLPTQACHVSVWHVKSPYVLTYLSLSFWGLVCLFDLRPFLHRPAALGSGIFIRTSSLPAEVCYVWVWYAYSPSVPTYRGLSRQGMACLVALCPTYKSLSCLGLVCLFTLRPYLHRPVAPESGMFIHTASLPSEACRAVVRHVYSLCMPTYIGLLRRGLAC